MSGRRAKTTPIRVWNTTPRDGSASLTGVRGVTDDPGCVWVLLDGARAGVVDRETAARLGLSAPTRAWTEDLAGSIDAEVRRRLCDRSAVRLLAARMRCRAGLVRALTQRGHDQRTAEACAERYAAMGALDDARYAEVVVRNELARKPAGRRLLEAKLRAQGVGGEAARDAVGRALEGRDELEDARKLAAASYRAMRPNTDAGAVRRRLSGRLARRGFSGEIVRRAVDEVMRGGGL
jgi:regulatory protein